MLVSVSTETLQAVKEGEKVVKKDACGVQSEKKPSSLG